ncbi:MAG: outer membrane protein assembly factor BamD [Bacteroidetes bacterium]|nr:outer membrane protein assembly factor BamD [Bacteroidota bacterium]
MRKLFYWLALGLVFWTSQACDPCRKMARSKDFALKDSAAYCYYERKQYESAALLLEELVGVYGPGPQAEKTMYYLASAKYYAGELLTASFTYNEFLQRYPGSSRAEAAHYQLAQCYYRMSNPWRLDQRDTYTAIERLQLFIELYPNGEQAKEATRQLENLRNRLATKAFRQADLYLNIYHYKAASFAFNSFMQDYPDSPYREEAQFKQYKATWYYADGSVDARKKERFEEANRLYIKFLDKYPNSKYLRSAERLYASTAQRMTLSGEKRLKRDRNQRRMERQEKAETQSKKEASPKAPKEKKSAEE